MRLLLTIPILSVLMLACSEKNRMPPVQKEPFHNQVEISFLGTEEENQYFGHQQGLSRVECRYNPAIQSLRVVAYRFDRRDSGIHITESVQISDTPVVTGENGLLTARSTDEVPAFVYLGENSILKYGKESRCSTYYTFSGDELQGNIYCSSLEAKDGEVAFVSMEFQCLNQDYIIMEIKKEMLDDEQ